MLGSVSSLEKIIVKLEADFDLRESPGSISRIDPILALCLYELFHAWL